MFINSVKHIKILLLEAISKLYQIHKHNNIDIVYNNNKLINGDLTFIMSSIQKKIFYESYNVIGNKLANYVIDKSEIVDKFEICDLFLNFFLSKKYFFSLLNNKIDLKLKKNQKKTIMIEFCSPNTNKPLHLGHLRNILIGNSLSNLLKLVGYQVIKTQIINDRGIHICKSMVSWQNFRKTSNKHKIIDNIKGDHLVGYYYVLFHKKLDEESSVLSKKGCKNNNFNNKSFLIQATNKMLIKWEQKDPKTIKLWNKLNAMVYKGFKKTYKRLGICFDLEQYESKIYDFGKQIIFDGLKKNIFFKKQDNSIWIDLTKEKLGKKLLLRGDGTSVYITQDIGVAVDRFINYPDLYFLIYVVGKEQDRHFKVLFCILQKLGFIWVNKLHHLSYEMVFLPTGKMKSRSGVTINIDDLLDKVLYDVKKLMNFLKKKKYLIEKNIYENISQSAIKYYLLNIHPRKKIIFDIKSSIDLKGKTGPYIQYTYVRINSLKKRIYNNYDYKNKIDINNNIDINLYEKKTLKIIDMFELEVKKSINNMNPSLISKYSFLLSKTYNELYEHITIIDNKNHQISLFRIKLSIMVGEILFICMKILDIEVLNKM